VLVGEACPVGEGVDDVHPGLAPAAVGPGAGDGVADAAVQQPARPALVQPLAPGGVQLTRGGQRGVEFLAVLHRLLVGEAVVVAAVEHFAWKTAVKMCWFRKHFYI